MENSSYVVKPELYQKDNEIKMKFIQSIKSITKHNHSVRLETNINQFYITLYEYGIIRFTTYQDVFDLDQSFPLEKLQIIEDYQLITKSDHAIITYLDIKIMIMHQPFIITVYKNDKIKFIQNAISFDNHKSNLFFDRNRDDYIYGLGEKTGFLNKNNEKTINWNKDVFEPHTRSNKELYVSINMFTYMSNGYKFGLFVDNPGKVSFDFDTYEFESNIQCEIGKLDYYLYTDETLKEIVISHTHLTGKTYLPPLWALGYHQSRHSYESIEVLLDVYNHFKERKIPVDAIYLDILYMDRYKVFTFNNETFKNISDVIHMLKEDGIKIVPIVDPGIKIEEGFSIYEQALKKDVLCKNNDSTIYTGEVWPGECIFYDFMNESAREEWGKLHSFYTDLGIEGIWNDMNEPAIFNSEGQTMDLSVIHNVDGKILTHKEVHNLYGLGMSRATYNGLKKLINKRPFVLTRAGYAGVQKYATVWTGDNRSSWEHLEMTIPMCLNLSMSGVALCGSDIGGFMDDCNEELLIRWMQIGVFLPFFRNHSSIGIKRQEPWQFGKRCEDISRKYIELRYQLIRYFYSEVFKSHQTGIPVMRPLVFMYEDDKNTYSIHDQFLIGDNLLIAPIVRPGENCRKVYLPKGIWFNFFTNEKHQGGQYILVHANLDEIPVFVKENSIIPISTSAENTQKMNNDIMINIYTNQDAFTDQFILDDGISFDYQNGDYTTFIISYDGEEITSYTHIENYQIQLKIIK